MLALACHVCSSASRAAAISIFSDMQICVAAASLRGSQGTGSPDIPKVWGSFSKDPACPERDLIHLVCYRFSRPG